MAERALSEEFQAHSEDISPLNSSLVRYFHHRRSNLWKFQVKAKSCGMDGDRINPKDQKIIGPPSKIVLV